MANKLLQMKIGIFPSLYLADASVKLQDLKQARRQGCNPDYGNKLADDVTPKEVISMVKAIIDKRAATVQGGSVLRELSSANHSFFRTLLFLDS